LSKEKILIPDSRGKMGDFIRTINILFEQKINLGFKNKKSADFQLLKRSKLINKNAKSTVLAIFT
jgi:hypothetical protein